MEYTWNPSSFRKRYYTHASKMKKLILVPLLLIGLLSFGQEVDSLLLEKMFSQVEQYFVKGQKDSALNLLDVLELKSKEAKIYPIYIKNLLAKANIQRQYHLLDQAKETTSILEEASIEFLEPDNPYFLVIYNIDVILFHETLEYEKRDFYLKKAREWFQQYGGSGKHFLAYSRILTNMGAISIDEGDFYKTIEYNQQILEMIPDSLEKSSFGIRILKDSHENVGTAFVGLKKYKKAIKSFKNAIQILIINGVKDQAYINMVNRRMSFAYLKDGNADKAIELCKKILDKLDSFTYAQRKDFELGSIYHILGQCYTQKSAFTQAENALLKAKSLREAYHLRYKKQLKNNEIGNTIFRLSELYQKQGKKELALQMLQKALIQYSISFNDTTILENPLLKDLKITAYYLAEILRSKAEILAEVSKQKNDKKLLEASLATYTLLIDLIDRDRQRYKAEESKVFLLSQAKPSFEGAISTAFELYKISKDQTFAESAFEFAEKSKAVLLFDALKASQASYAANVPDSLLEKERSLENKLSMLGEKIYFSTNSSTVNDSLVKVYKSDAFALRQNLEELNDKLENQYPKYFELRNAKGGIKIPELQLLLKRSNRHLLEYFVGDQQVFVFYVSTRGISIRAIERNDFFDQTLSSVLDELQGVISSDSNSFQKHAHSMYKILLDSLGIHNGTQNLIIIPDGVLGYLPFDILIHSENSQNYLINEFAISYAYSAKLLFKNPIYQRKRKKAKKGLLSYAPNYTNDEYLEYNKDEVVGINRIFSGDIRLGRDASEHDYLENSPNHSMIHFAMHGYINQDEPLFSYLAFSSDSAQNINGELYAYQIYNQNLNTELVALSACNTGYGPLLKGEGIMSLARAFRYAGSSSVLMNLWKSDGAISAELMKEFYSNLSTGMYKDEALRAAKLAYLEKASPNRKSPRYWANLVLIGENGPLDEGNRYVFVLMIGFMLTLLSGLIYFFYKKNKSD